MPGKRFTAEQIVAKLREAEKLQGQGSTIPAVCKRLQVWRADVLPVAHEVRGVEGGRGPAPEGFGAGELPAEADRGRAGVGHLDVEGSAVGKMVSPARRREAVAFLVRRHKVSERRACSVVGQHRSTQRYTPVPEDFERRLVEAMRAHAEAHPRWGYRRIHALLVSDGWAVNVKRVHRLWVLEGLRVPARRKHHGQKAGGIDENSAWALPAVHRDHVWSYDFVAARTTDGLPLRILNIVDEYTREAIVSHVARSIGARDVTKVLATAFAVRGKPEVIRSDNGREFIATTVVDWLTQHGVTAAFIAKASPQQNCYVERFNGSMRDELLDGELFHTVLEAQVVIDEWLQVYNTFRPHRGLGMMTPAAFAATL